MDKSELFEHEPIEWRSWKIEPNITMRYGSICSPPTGHDVISKEELAKATQSRTRQAIGYCNEYWNLQTRLTQSWKEGEPIPKGLVVNHDTFSISSIMQPSLRTLERREILGI